MPRTYQKRRIVQIDDEFERLTVKELFKGPNGKTIARCLCKCGQYTDQRATSLVQGEIKSCGCLKAEKASERTKQRNYKHGKGNLNSRLYRIWAQMRARCKITYGEIAKYYFNKGITVCKEWDDFEKFEEWSLNNGYADNLSLDRINGNGNYEQDNCRWATAQQQSRNRRNNRLDTVSITAFGETKKLFQWLEDNRCNIKSGATICYRIGAGWTPEEAITKPSERRFAMSEENVQVEADRGPVPISAMPPEAQEEVKRQLEGQQDKAVAAGGDFNQAIVGAMPNIMNVLTHAAQVGGCAAVDDLVVGLKSVDLGPAGAAVGMFAPTLAGVLKGWIMSLGAPKPPTPPGPAPWPVPPPSPYGPAPAPAPQPYPQPVPPAPAPWPVPPQPYPAPPVPPQPYPAPWPPQPGPSINVK